MSHYMNKSLIRLTSGIVSHACLMLQPSKVVVGSNLRVDRDSNSCILKEPWKAIQLMAQMSLFLARVMLLAVKRAFNSFMTGMVIANLGILLFTFPSSCSLPLMIAATKAGFKLPGITPSFR